MLPNNAIIATLLALISSGVIPNSLNRSSIAASCKYIWVSVNELIGACVPAPGLVATALALGANSTPVRVDTFFKNASGDFLRLGISLANFLAVSEALPSCTF